MTKSGKKRVLKKKSGKVRKFEKTSDTIISKFLVFYFQKSSNGKKLIKNFCSENKIAKFSYKFLKLLNFQCLHLVKIDKISLIKLQKLSINILNNYPITSSF